MERNLQFRSEQLGRESTDIEKDSYTSFGDSFIAECSSAESSIHKHAQLESAYRRTRPRNGKRPVEVAMIQTAMKTLGLM